MRQQIPRLLAGRDDQRRAIAEGRVEIAHGMAEPGRRMKIDEGGFPGNLRIGVGHGHHDGFLQAEHIGEIPRQIDEHRQFRRTRISEHPVDPLPAQEIKHGLGNCQRAKLRSGQDVRRHAVHASSLRPL